jgi:hypothetical protein
MRYGGRVDGIEEEGWLRSEDARAARRGRES